MLLCYVDESGNDQVLSGREAPPVFVLVGLVVPEARLKSLVWTYLRIKKQFTDQLNDDSMLSDLIKTEIKGADLRADIRKGNKRRVRRAVGILDKVMLALEEANVQIIGQIWVKQDGGGLPHFHYARGISRMADAFQSQLAAADAPGVMIIDARTKVKNTPIVHGITTRKLKTGGDALANLKESPVFGHSDSHVALQLADLVASALLFPMACLTYCGDVEGNAHPHPQYGLLQERFGKRLHAMEYRYVTDEGNESPRVSWRLDYLDPAPAGTGVSG